MTDSIGTVVWEADYLPFGKATVDEDPDGDQENVASNLRFPGQYFDSETGLHYNWHRDYHPGIGRYIEVDPSLQLHQKEEQIPYYLPLVTRIPQLLNIYNYAYNNPIISADPAGLVTVYTDCSRWTCAPAVPPIAYPKVCVRACVCYDVGCDGEKTNYRACLQWGTIYGPPPPSYPQPT